MQRMYIELLVVGAAVLGVAAIIYLVWRHFHKKREGYAGFAYLSDVYDDGTDGTDGMDDGTDDQEDFEDARDPVMYGNTEPYNDGMDPLGDVMMPYSETFDDGSAYVDLADNAAPFSMYDDGEDDGEE